jgi:hypothetical protein
MIIHKWIDLPSILTRDVYRERVPLNTTHQPLFIRNGMMCLIKRFVSKGKKEFRSNDVSYSVSKWELCEKKT